MVSRLNSSSNSSEVNQIIPDHDAPAVREHAELEEIKPSFIKNADQKQTVLVTGHAGFIGFHVVKALLERGDNVVGIDSLNTHYDIRLKRERLALLVDLAKATGQVLIDLRGDLTDKTVLESCFLSHKIQRVIHLAGQTDKFLSNGTAQSCVQNNIHAFAQLLEFCKTYKIQNLTYASSHAVYGSGLERPMSEQDCANYPLRLDAATQRSCELMAHSYSYLFSLPTTGLRFFSVYGPWGRPDSVLFVFARKIVEGKPIQIYNEGENSRDYTYIADVVESVIRANDSPTQVLTHCESKEFSSTELLKNKAPWQVVNVGASVPISIERLIFALETALEKKAIKEYLTGPILEMGRSCADIQHLKKVFKYSPRTSFEEGIAEFVKWFRHYYQL